MRKVAPIELGPTRRHTCPSKRVFTRSPLPQMLNTQAAAIAQDARAQRWDRDDGQNGGFEVAMGVRNGPLSGERRRDDSWNKNTQPDEPERVWNHEQQYGILAAHRPELRPMYRAATMLKAP